MGTLTMENQFINQNKIHNKKELGQDIPFSRIRRITGYLTGDINTWNNSKKQELNDRVKHT